MDMWDGACAVDDKWMDALLMKSGCDAGDMGCGCDAITSLLEVDGVAELAVERGLELLEALLGIIAVLLRGGLLLAHLLDVLFDEGAHLVG